MAKNYQSITSVALFVVASLLLNSPASAQPALPCPAFGCTTVGQCSSGVSGQLNPSGPGLFSKMNIVPGVGSVTQYADCCRACELFSSSCSHFTYAVQADGTKECFLYNDAICAAGTMSFTPTADNYTTGSACETLDSTPPSPAGVQGDPHYTGADSSRFDFTGVPDKSYCMLSDAHLHINVYHGGRFDQWGDDAHKPLTWIRQVAVLWGHHTIRLAARAGGTWQYENGYMARMAVDGTDVSISQPGSSLDLLDGDVTLTWVAARVRDGNDDIDVYELLIRDVLRMRLKIRPEVELLRTATDGVVHFSVELVNVAVSPNVHGVLGQTYRRDHSNRLAKQTLVFSELLNANVIPGDNGENFLDGTPDEYETSSVMSADCKHSRFGRAGKLDAETARSIEISTGGVFSSYVRDSRDLMLKRTDAR